MPHATSHLTFAFIKELGHLLQSKQISSVELTQHFLGRLSDSGPRYNALAELTPDLALAQARQADERIAHGDIGSPLLGIPFGVKDILATRGIPTRWGAPPFQDQIFDYDATVIRRLQGAGAVLIGKLAMIELAGGGSYEYASASLHGPGRNPWNAQHWAGGSSTGSGIAVAAGLVPYALGSETWGSIVTPSAYCGVTGLRPTWGRVSRFGAMELAWSMDKVGPMAHSAYDCGIVLQAISGYDSNDFTTGKLSFDFSPTSKAKSFRLGVLPADFTHRPELDSAFGQALQTFQELGMQIKQIQLPPYSYELTAVPLLHGESALALGSFIRSDAVEQLIDSAQIKGLKAALDLPAEEYARALHTRQQLVPEVLSIFEQVDALLTPAVMDPAPRIETNLKPVFRSRGGYSALGALCGVPSLTLPIGFTTHGLPLALSLIGNRFEENTILQIGTAFQEVTNWHTQHPILS